MKILKEKNKIRKVHYYRGYAIDKPEGCSVWNIHEILENGEIDWCFSIAHPETLKEAKCTIDAIIEEGW